jgi:hypothetical protein
VIEVRFVLPDRPAGTALELGTGLEPEEHVRQDPARVRRRRWAAGDER